MKPKDYFSKAIELAEAIDYQEDSIVSREITKKRSGTVTIFAFDKGQGLSEHTAPFDAIVLVIEGKVEIKISGKSHKLSGGQLIVMPANRPHSLNALEKFKMMLVMIK